MNPEADKKEDYENSGSQVFEMPRPITFFLRMKRI